MATKFAKSRYWPPELDALDIARLTALPGTYDYSTWWPTRWAEVWRLVVPAHEPDGTLASVHARSIYPSSTPRQRWPHGYEAAGLLLADRSALGLMRGQLNPGLIGVVIAEGITDYIAACLWVHQHDRPLAVIGVTSGAPRALADVRWPVGFTAFVATHADAAGDRYAEQVRRALPGHVHMRRSPRVT